MSEELDYSHALNHGYTIEDFVKIINLKNPNPEGPDDVAYKNFIHQVATKVLN